MEDEGTKETWLKSVLHSAYTLAVFVGFLLVIPPLILTFLYVQLYRWIFNIILAWKYPYLEVVRRLSARGAMDTYRTQGVLTIVLQIKGQCDVALVKQKILRDVVERQRKDGSLRFPHMKNCLTSCWGRYAWVRDTRNFDIENHVIHVANPVLRNRLVTSANIQEYISDAVTKFIPPWNNTPPWQIMLITTEPNKFYMLARVHHLYLSEDCISFGHLLMIDPEDVQWVHTRSQDIDSIENILQQIFRKPKACPMLYDHVSGTLSNAWNELIAAYDPLQNPYFEKSAPNIFQFNVICMITAMAVIKEYFRSQQSLLAIIKKETQRRQVTFFLFVRCCMNTLYPFVIIKITIAWCWWICVKGILHFPITVLHIMYETPEYMKWFFTTLRALGEVVYIFHLIYTAPRVLLDELFWPLFRRPRHHLERASLSGRKVVRWTEPIPIDLIRKIRDKTGVASCEIQLYGVAAALNEYIQKNNLNEGNEILTTTRFIPQEHLLKSANRISSGLLCLALPMNMPEDDALYGLHLMQLALQNAMTNQTALYLASLWQYDYGLLTSVFPSVVARILLYVLSTRYSIMVTQIEAHTKEMRKRRLVWGQEVESFIYWRPPQANVSLSVTLINYGDEMRFAVMADAQLAPKYTTVVSRYVSYIQQLAEEAENYAAASTASAGIHSSLPTIMET